MLHRRVSFPWLSLLIPVEVGYIAIQDPTPASGYKVIMASHQSIEVPKSTKKSGGGARVPGCLDLTETLKNSVMKLNGILVILR